MPGHGRPSLHQVVQRDVINSVSCDGCDGMGSEVGRHVLLCYLGMGGRRPHQVVQLLYFDVVISVLSFAQLRQPIEMLVDVGDAVFPQGLVPITRRGTIFKHPFVSIQRHKLHSFLLQSHTREEIMDTSIHTVGSVFVDGHDIAANKRCGGGGRTTGGSTAGRGGTGAGTGSCIRRCFAVF